MKTSLKRKMRWVLLGLALAISTQAVAWTWPWDDCDKNETDKCTRIED
jgi:hypothetical protein